MTGWETQEREVAYSCEGFDIVTQTVELPNGETAEFDYLSEQESVVVLPFTPDGDVVVIDEWRHAVGRENRGLPAGTLEDNEKTDAGVRRELREETGYEPDSVTHMTSVEPANGFSDALFHYYLATGCKRTGDQSLDTDETITVSTTAFETLVEGVRDGTLRDGRSAFAVLYYELFHGG